MSLGKRVTRMLPWFVERMGAGMSFGFAAKIVSLVTILGSGFAAAEAVSGPVYSACHLQIAFAAFAQETPKTSDETKVNAVWSAANANTALASQQYSVAIERFDRAIALSPANPAFFIGRGRAKLESGELDGALEDFDQVDRLNPRSFLAQTGRAQAFARKRKREDALVAFEAAAKLYPRNAAACVGSGFIRLRERDYDKGVADFSEAIRIDPTCGINFMYRGVAYELKSEKVLADADYAKMKRLRHAGTPDPLYARALAFGRLGMHERQLEDLNELVALNPRDAAALNNRCYVHAILGKFESALADCEEALRIAPDAAHTLDSRGFTHLRMGDLDGAVVDYDAALRINPRLAQALYGRGVVKRLKGDTLGGDADFAAARAVFPLVADETAELGVK